MANIKNIAVGQTVYSVTTGKMGNTTIRAKRVHPVFIKEINVDENWVMASWNGNPPTRFYERDVKKWKIKYPGN